MSSMKKRGMIALAIAGAAALAVAIPTVVAGSLAGGPSGTAAVAGPKASAVFTGTCPTTKTTIAANDAVDSTGTSSSSYTTVPGMSVTFRGHCAVITFSAWPYATDTELIFVRAMVNGTICKPGNSGYFDGGVQFATNHTVGEFADARSYTFACAGYSTSPFHPNTATVEWMSGFEDPVFMHQPIMTVQHG